MTPLSRAEINRRYRERHPEYREREKARMRQANSARDRETERERIAEYRATHPLQTILTSTRHNANRRPAANEGNCE